MDATKPSLTASNDMPALRRLITTTPETSVQSGQPTSIIHHEERTTRDKYTEIGRGGCGVVFQSPGPDFVALKLYVPQAYPPDQRYDAARVGHDYEQHKKIELAWTQSAARTDLPLLPRLIAYLPTGEKTVTVMKRDRTPSSNSDFWQGCASSLPEYWQSRKDNEILLFERVPALDIAIRRHLINLYCPNELKRTILASENDKDCLVRLYLGRASDRRVKEEGRRPNKFFTLRNFKLHLDLALDDVTGLGYDMAVHYAKIMANGLATCHWIAGVDANDVEFVLGGSPSAVHGHKDSEQRQTSDVSAYLWMFDFDKSMDITEWNLAGMHKAARAAEYNDPYFPRPCCTDEMCAHLWQEFEYHYLLRSRDILGGCSAKGHLPRVFIEEWKFVRAQRVQDNDKARERSFQGDQ